MDARIIYNDSVPSENREICNLLCFTVFTRAHGSDARLFTSRGSHVIITRSNELQGFAGSQNGGI